MTEVEWFGEPDREPVVLAAWDPSWQAAFRTWESRLREKLGPAAGRVHHVGSTAIAGMVAKPVIDILVAVHNVSDEPSYRPAIESLGLPLRAREADHRFFRRPAGEARDVHVHVSEAGSRWERDHVLFRDYLREHPEAARGYADLKRRLAQQFGHDRGRYTEAKTDFIAAVLGQAEVWARRTGWQL